MRSKAVFEARQGLHSNCIYKAKKTLHRFLAKFNQYISLLS